MKNRLVPVVEAGITDKRSAPHWSGDRAEDVFTKRTAERDALAASKKSKKRTRSTTPRAPRGDGTRTPREKTPQRELTRLLRALARRKTLAARQRCQQRIDALKRELGQA